jgi:hypothetical protein
MAYTRKTSVTFSTLISSDFLDSIMMGTEDSLLVDSKSSIESIARRENELVDRGVNYEVIGKMRVHK